MYIDDDNTLKLPIVKEQGSVNLNPVPASCLYESRGQQARPRLALALFSGENTPSIDTNQYLQLLPEVCRSIISGPPCIYGFPFLWDAPYCFTQNYTFVKTKKIKSIANHNCNFLVLNIYTFISRPLYKPTIEYLNIKVLYNFKFINSE